VGFVVGFDKGGKVLRATLDGILTEDTLVDLTAAVRGIIQSQTPDAIIVDLSSITGFEISTQVVRSIARTPSPSALEIERVVVAPQDHIFGVTRMFQSYAEGNRPNVHVVKSLEEAYRYLRSKYRPRRSA
jgi:hypothetical protein